MGTIPEFLDSLASRHRTETAIIADDETLSFAELARRSERVAAGLAALGIGRGDRVAIWLPNLPACLEIACACARIGAVVISCNTRFRSTEMADILARSGAKALVLSPDFKRIRFLEILADIPADHLAKLESVVVLGDVDRVAVPGRRRAVAYADLRRTEPVALAAPAPDAGFVTFLTSGTTSLPKFALHSQAAVARHGHDVADAFGYRHDGVVVLTMNPLCGVLGFNQSFAALAAGVPQVLPTAFEAAPVADAMRRHRVTHTAGIDEALVRLLDAVPDTPAFPALHSVGSGSFNADFEAFVRTAEARGVRAFGIYGMSEVMAMFSRRPADAAVGIRARAGGRPVNPMARVRARDPDTGALLGHGEVGELEISAPSLTLGYDGDPAATERAISPDGFLRTGDVGHTEPDGSFTFLSRMGDALRLSGFLVSPQEIAAVLEAHPSVDRCQVVGHELGAALRPVAFVIPRRGGAPFDEAAVVAFCKERLAPFKAPARVLPVDAFPTTVGPNGEKVQRSKLREMAAAALS